MAPAATVIYDLCADLLAAVVARHGSPLPARRYVAAGAPAWDCELLATWCERTAGLASADPAQEGLVAHSREPTHAMRYGVFVVTLMRCTPAVPDTVGTEAVLPTVADEQAAAAALYEDGQRLVNAVVAAEKAGELVGCHGLALVDWRVIGPDGGLVAGELRLRIALTGV